MPNGLLPQSGQGSKRARWITLSFGFISISKVSWQLWQTNLHVPVSILQHKNQFALKFKLNHYPCVYDMGHAPAGVRGLRQMTLIIIGETSPLLKKYDNSINSMERPRRSKDLLRSALHCSERSLQLCRCFFIRVVR